MYRVMTVALYPTKSQAATLDSWMVCARRVWNHFLEHRIKAYKRRKQSVSYYDQTAMLTKWRENDPRMSAASVAVQRDALDRLNKAFQAFFRRVKAGQKPGFPRFKGKGRWQSVLFTDPRRYIIAGGIKVPKLGMIVCRNLRPVDGKIKSLRILKRANRWFAQLLIDDGKTPPPKRPVESTVGVDVGLESFATLSTGEQIENPRWTRKIARKLRRAQQIVSRRKKGSKRRERAKLGSVRV